MEIQFSNEWSYEIIRQLIFPITRLKLIDVFPRDVHLHVGIIDEDEFIENWIVIEFLNLTLLDKVVEFYNKEGVIFNRQENILFIQIPAEHWKMIISPILIGKYSEIFKPYITYHFNPHLLTDKGTLINNPVWGVVNKTEDLRDYLETELDTTIPEEAELASIPNVEKIAYHDKKRAWRGKVGMEIFPQQPLV